MLEKEKAEIIAAGVKLDRYGLISLSGGNVSMRIDEETLLVTPSGMMYEEMVPEDVLVMALDGTIIEGARRPSVDTIAIRYIFQKMPAVNAVIHTHQPYATGIGLVVDRIDCDVTTLANTAKGHVNVAPYSSAASIDMGYAEVDHIGDQLAVVMKKHGVVTIGKSLKVAFYADLYLEEAAKTLYVAHSYGGKVAKLNEEQIQTAVEVFKDYGQVKG